MIQSNQTQSMNNYFSPQTPSFFNLTQHNLPSYPFNTFSTQIPLQEHSTSDETDDNQINERKKRRMISNRESARRSRMRKQRHLDELWSQAIRMSNENHKLIDKMNLMLESHERVVEENLMLKEEACELRQVLMDHKVSDYYSVLRDLEEIQCDVGYLRDESSELSFGSSLQS